MLNATPSANSDYPPTWYAANGRALPLQDDLRAAINTDVCIVGGGLAGLSIAWRLCQQGASVALLESKRIAWGASGRNGGFVTPGFAGDIEAVEAAAGKDVARRLYQYSIEGAETVWQNIQKFAPHCLMGEGKYSVSRYPAAMSMRKEADRLTQEFGDPVEYLDAATLQSHIHSKRYFEGIYKPRGFQIQPLDYARALAEQILSAGGKIFEQTAALSIVRGKERAGWQVTTLKGSVQSTQLILCTSGYDSGLYRPLSRSVLPVSTHVVVTEPLSDDQLSIINTRCGIADTGNACDYYRLIDDNRLLWGGKITTATTQPKDLDRQMKAAIADVFPDFTNLRLDYRWSGLMGYCRHRMPLILQPENGLWIATAFGGHGLNTTAMAGNLVSSAITAEDTRWTDFSDYGLVWNGGVFGQAAVQSSYWWMQAKDRLLEARASRHN